MYCTLLIFFFWLIVVFPESFPLFPTYHLGAKKITQVFLIGPEGWPVHSWLIFSKYSGFCCHQGGPFIHILSVKLTGAARVDCF